MGNQIVHVLFLDIVGYSKYSVDNQSRLIRELNGAIQATTAFQQAKARGDVSALATGDGSALVFTNDVDAPARCALELASALPKDFEARMGLHSGLIQRQPDINGRPNFAGDGINTAQRVMDFGQPGHILMSGQYAAWLSQFEDWKGKVVPLGEGTAKHGQKLELFALVSNGIGRSEVPEALHSGKGSARSGSKKIVLLYRRNTQPDGQLLEVLEDRLSKQGFELFIDRHLKIGVEWAKAIEERIRAADAVIALISDSALGSEMLEYELETAYDEFSRRGKPFIYLVRVGSDAPVEGPVGAIVNKLQFTHWRGPADDDRLVKELVEAVEEPQKPKEDRPLEPVGGAMTPDSPFYVERATDPEFFGALRANESIVLVKGPRQMGKTSLIGRGAKWARENGRRVAMTDFQKLSGTQLASDEAFYRVLAATLAKQLGVKYDFATEWLDVFGANMNLENFIRAVLDSSPEPLVWFMDEADKLFGVSFSSDFFGLVRSWHNSRATEPDGPWSRFTVVIGYATEAHLFIQDLNQSPFNVGRQIRLLPFTHEQTSDLNERYGRPLGSREDVDSIFGLVGGQPFLTRRALDVLARKQTDLQTLLSTADRDEGPFGDHLKRILIGVSQLPTVVEAIRSAAASAQVKESEGYYRLLAAGVVEHTTDGSIKFTSELYSRYLKGHLVT